MAIEVKDDSGDINEVASNAKGNLGVTLGAVGAGLGLLGLVGAGGAMASRGGVGGGSVEQDTPVSVFRYFDDRMRDNDKVWALALDSEKRFSELSSRIAVNETANAYQNQMTAMGFANVAQRFETENVINDKNLQLAMCGTIKGDTYIPFNKLGMGVRGAEYGINTYPLPPYPYFPPFPPTPFQPCTPPAVSAEQ